MADAYDYAIKCGLHNYHKLRIATLALKRIAKEEPRPNESDAAFVKRLKAMARRAVNRTDKMETH
jgi:hypothetical protein